MRYIEHMDVQKLGIARLYGSAMPIHSSAHRRQSISAMSTLYKFLNHTPTEDN